MDKYIVHIRPLYDPIKIVAVVAEAPSLIEGIYLAGTKLPGEPINARKLPEKVEDYYDYTHA